MLTDKGLRQLAHDYLERRLTEDTVGQPEALLAVLLAIAEELSTLTTTIYKFLP